MFEDCVNKFMKQVHAEDLSNVIILFDFKSYIFNLFKFRYHQQMIF